MRVQFFGNIREVFREGFGLCTIIGTLPVRRFFIDTPCFLLNLLTFCISVHSNSLSIINSITIYHLYPLYTSHLSHLYLSSLTFNSSLPSYLLLTNYHLPFGLLREREREIQSLPVMGRDKNDEYTHTFRLDIEMLIYVKVEDIIFV